MPRRPELLLSAAALLFITGSSEAQLTPGQVQAACKACDAQVDRAILNYQTKFGNYSKAIDGAKYHCGVFLSLKSCYTDALRDNIGIYNSDSRATLEQLYAVACDSTCYMAVLPWCYMKTVGAYDRARNCNGSMMNPDLKACAETELFVNQNCTGVCTEGQRRAAYFMFSTMSECSISFNTEYSCYDVTTYCSDSAYGSFGSAFIAYSNSTLMDSNQLACSIYGDFYSKCMQQAVSSVVVLGSNPEYATTYETPCAKLASEVQSLQNYARTKLAGKMCEAPKQSFIDICRAYIMTPATTLSTAPPTIATSPTPNLPTVSVSTIHVMIASTVGSASIQNASSTYRAELTAALQTSMARTSSRSNDVTLSSASPTNRAVRTRACGKTAAASAISLCFTVMSILSYLVKE